jgi:hypothetical protein
LECFVNIPGHTSIYKPFGVIPVKTETYIKVSCPVDGDCVFLLKCLDEMFSMIFAGVMNAKVVNNKTKRDGPGDVCEKSVSVLRLVISMLG